MSHSHNIISKKSTLKAKLDTGSAILLPTDTLPALAASPAYAYTLWKIKKRPLNKPLILMGSKQQELFKWVLHEARKDADSMASRYWPGALTIVLPSSGDLLKKLNPKANSLGYRIPDCSITNSFLDEVGPLATTSANISGEVPGLTAQEVAKDFPELPLLGPTPWPYQSGLASTVISWQSSGNWHLLREGPIIPEEIAQQ